jgi:inner membrane protein
MRSSGAELSQMMVYVQIAPAHPFSFGHRTEDRVRLPREIPRLARKAVQKAQQVLYIAFEDNRRRAALFGIHFGPCRCAVRPLEGNLQRDPFHKPAGHGDGSDGNPFRYPWFFAHRHPEGIREVTDHLWRRHFSPSTRARRLNLRDAFDNLLLVRWISQGSLCHDAVLRQGIVYRESRGGCILNLHFNRQYRGIVEPITHFLTGACMGRAGFNRRTALATATMTLAAEAPDLDVLGRFRGAVFAFAHHRGFTHSFLGLIPVSAAVVGVIYLVWLLRGRKTKDPNLPARWGLLFVFAYIAGLSHILLDYTNGYGVRPFWPFSEKWYSWDIVFIAEPILWAVLLLGLVVPGFLGLINQEIGVRQKGLRGRRAAIAALAAMVLLWGVRDYEHRRAVNALRARTYGEEQPIRVGAFPTYINPFQWHGVVETRSLYALAEVSSLGPEVGPGDKLDIQYKPEETPVTLAAKRSYLGRVYLDWAEFPMTETEKTPSGGYLVLFYDLRFEELLRSSGRRPLSGGVILESNLNVILEFMGAVSQPTLD